MASYTTPWDTIGLDGVSASKLAFVSRMIIRQAGLKCR